MLDLHVVWNEDINQLACVLITCWNGTRTVVESSNTAVDVFSSTYQRAAAESSFHTRLMEVFIITAHTYTPHTCTYLTHKLLVFPRTTHTATHCTHMHILHTCATHHRHMYILPCIVHVLQSANCICIRILHDNSLIRNPKWLPYIVTQTITDHTPPFYSILSLEAEEAG